MPDYVVSFSYWLLEHSDFSLALVLFVLSYIRPPWTVTAVATLGCLPKISSERVTQAASGAAHGFCGSQTLF